MLEHLRAGFLETNRIHIDVPIKEEDARGAAPQISVVLQRAMGQGGKAKSEKKHLPISEARKILAEVETDRLLATQDVKKTAIRSVLSSASFLTSSSSSSSFYVLSSYGQRVSFHGCLQVEQDGIVFIDEIDKICT